MKAAALLLTTFITPLFSATPAETASVKTFLADFCVKCHGTEKQKGDIRLDELTGDFLKEGTSWAVVLEQVRSGEMPPEEAKQQPTAVQRKALIAWVSGQLGLTAFETLHGRQGAIDAIKPKISATAPKLDAQFAKPTEVNRLQAQFEIATAALLAGLTNSVTIASGGGHQNYLSWPDLGIPIDGHSVGHGTGVEGLTPEEIHVKVRQFHCQLIAKMAAKLASIREGYGTMLDHTLIVYLSDSGEAHHPNLRQWPVVLLGGMGGKLKPGGRYVQLPHYGAKKHRTLSNLYFTLLHAAGKPRDKFGAPDNGLRGIEQSGLISELVA